VFPDKVGIVAKSQNRTVEKYDGATDDAEDDSVDQQKRPGADDEVQAEDLGEKECQNNAET